MKTWYLFKEDWVSNNIMKDKPTEWGIKVFVLCEDVVFINCIHHFPSLMGKSFNCCDKNLNSSVLFFSTRRKSSHFWRRVVTDTRLQIPLPLFSLVVALFLMYLSQTTFTLSAASRCLDTHKVRIQYQQNLEMFLLVQDTTYVLQQLHH